MRRKATPKLAPEPTESDKEPLDLSDVPDLVFAKPKPPPKKRRIETAAQFDAVVDKYVAEQRLNNKPITISGMALALGFANKVSIFDYGQLPEFKDSVARCRLLYEEGLEERLIKGNNVQGVTFALCQPWMGWKNPRYEHRITHEGEVQHTHKRGPDWSKLDDDTLEKVAQAALPPPRNAINADSGGQVIDLKPEHVRVGNGKN